MNRSFRRFAPLALLLATGCMEDAFAAASTDNQGAYLVGGKGPFPGRVDGIGFDLDNYGPGIVSNGELEAMFSSSQYVSVFEDFLGDFTIPAEGSADGAQGPWVSTNTGTSQTIAPEGDYDNGALEILISNSNEVGDATLFWDDEQNIDTDTEPFCVYRWTVQATPAAADSIFLGLATAQNDIMQSVSQFAGFSVAGADLNLDTQSDDNTTDVAADDTDVDLTALTFIETLVSMNSMHGRTATDPDGASPTDVHFFYRTSTGGAWTQVNPNVTFSIGADAAVQPYVQVEKTSGTSTPGIFVDYVRCAWQRE